MKNVKLLSVLKKYIYFDQKKYIVEENKICPIFIKFCLLSHIHIYIKEYVAQSNSRYVLGI